MEHIRNQQLLSRCDVFSVVSVAEPIKKKKKRNDASISTVEIDFQLGGDSETSSVDQDLECNELIRNLKAKPGPKV